MGEELNGSGKPIHETVQEYADNLDIWLEDFVNVWEKMSQNGNSDLVDGPKNIMTSRCCIHSSVKYTGGTILETRTRPNGVVCQNRCRFIKGCNWFVYETETKECQLFDAKPGKVSYDGNNWLAGPPNCSQDEKSCNAYKTI